VSHELQSCRVRILEFWEFPLQSPKHAPSFNDTGLIKMGKFEGSTPDALTVTVSLTVAPVSEGMTAAHGSSVTSITPLQSPIIGVTSFVMIWIQLTCSQAVECRYF